jgi:predicted nucleotidyltransferase
VLYKDKILAEIIHQLPKKDLDLKEIVVYGSVSRRDATPMSDIDLVLITTNVISTKQVFQEIRTQIFLKYSVPVTALYVLPEEFVSSLDPLFRSIRKEGIHLWKRKET